MADARGAPLRICPPIPRDRHMTVASRTIWCGLTQVPMRPAGTPQIVWRARRAAFAGMRRAREGAACRDNPEARNVALGDAAERNKTMKSFGRDARHFEAAGG